jgi:hypothetical protein
MKRLALLFTLCASFAAAQVCPQGFALSGSICISSSVVNGASNLTTAGAIPYVSAPYTVNQDPTNFFWDSTNHRLGIGNAAPTARLDIQGSGIDTGLIVKGGDGGTGTTLAAFKIFGGSNAVVIDGAGNVQTNFNFLPAGGISSGGALTIKGGGANYLNLGNGAGYYMSFYGTGDVALGDQSAGNGNYRLDVQKSGSAGTLRVFDQTASTGTTQGAVKAGAGQGSTALWLWQSNAGVTLAGVDANGLAVQAVGTLASGATIAPVKTITHITGTTTISTITAPTAFALSGVGGCLTLVPDGLWATNTAGNVSIATTAVVSKQLVMCYDNATSKWYPSY